MELNSLFIVAKGIMPKTLSLPHENIVKGNFIRDVLSVTSSAGERLIDEKIKATPTAAAYAINAFSSDMSGNYVYETVEIIDEYFTNTVEIIEDDYHKKFMPVVNRELSKKEFLDRIRRNENLTFNFANYINDKNEEKFKRLFIWLDSNISFDKEELLSWWQKVEDELSEEEVECKKHFDYLFSKIYEDDDSEILHFLLYGPPDIKADLLQGLNRMTKSPLVNLKNLENIYLRNFFDFKLKLRLAGVNFKYPLA